MLLLVVMLGMRCTTVAPKVEGVLRSIHTYAYIAGHLSPFMKSTHQRLLRAIINAPIIPAPANTAPLLINRDFPCPFDTVYDICITDAVTVDERVVSL